jgi:ribonucleotide reductase alpha subunit
MKPEQQYVYTRSYSRWNEAEGRREFWNETVDRYISYMQSKLGFSDYFADMGREAILKMDVVPSMRAMWAAGSAADASNVTIYNCSYLPVDSLRSFAETLYILMCGTGVGFSIESKYVNKLPDLPKKLDNVDETLVVQDSKIGWADALLQFMEALYDGKILKVDCSLVRPKGSRLKTMGGRASGPEPFQDLLKFITNKVSTAIFLDKRNKLSTLDCLDIQNKIAEIVVVGGVRRSSQISLSDFDDTAVATAKSGEFWIDNPHRAMSNNSVSYTSRPPFNDFLKEFTNLITSGTGERGIFNRDAAVRWAKYSGRRDPNHEWGTNPCLPPGTMVLTRDGHFPIEELVNKLVDIWDGNRWVTIDNFRQTGENQPLLKITMQDGSEECMTPYHKCVLENGDKVEAKDLRPGDRLAISNAPLVTDGVPVSAAYLKGFLIGDGTSNKREPTLWLYDTKYCCEQRLLDSYKEIAFNTELPEFVDSTYNRKRMKGLNNKAGEFIDWTTTYKNKLPSYLFSADFKSKCEFIAGLFDSDGCASDTKNGWMYQLSSVSKELLLDVQKLLKTIGVYSKVCLNKKAGIVDFNDGYGQYETKDLYRLTISQESSVTLAKSVVFSRLISFANKETTYKLKTNRNTFVDVTPAGISEKVYCCTVPTNHCFSLSNGLLYGQCGEILLRPYSFCNLSEVVARSNDSLEDLKHKVKVAVMFGAWQAMFTDFPFLNPQWKKNAEEERLLGVSVTGIMDHKTLGATNSKANKWWAELKSTAIAEAERWAKRLGCNMSAAITCVKPSGTVSQLTDAASGIHPRYANYYLRRYRISTTDPLFKMVVSQGMPWSPENGQTVDKCDTAVVTFPVKAPPGSKTRNDMTAIEQLEHWKMVKHFWSEHNPSITVYVGDDEWFKVADWVWNNFDDIGGLSFLPKHNHIYQQAPYEEINEERYKEELAKMPKLDYTQLSKFEIEDATEGAKTLACVGDKCEL